MSAIFQKIQNKKNERPNRLSPNLVSKVSNRHVRWHINYNCAHFSDDIPKFTKVRATAQVFSKNFKFHKISIQQASSFMQIVIGPMRCGCFTSSPNFNLLSQRFQLWRFTFDSILIFTNLTLKSWKKCPQYLPLNGRLCGDNAREAMYNIPHFHSNPIV